MNLLNAPFSPGSEEMSDSDFETLTEEDEMRQFVRFCDEILVILNNRCASVFLNAIDDKFTEEEKN